MPFVSQLAPHFMFEISTFPQHASFKPTTPLTMHTAQSTSVHLCLDVHFLHSFVKNSSIFCRKSPCSITFIHLLINACYCTWLLFLFVPGFALLTTMTWLYHILRPRVMVRTVSASWHPRFGTCCHLISRTVTLVTNSSSRALRLGSLCKPTQRGASEN